jgi:hypothetical protein
MMNRRIHERLRGAACAVAYTTPFVPLLTYSQVNTLGLSGGSERRIERRYKVRLRVALMREDSPEVEGEVSDLSAGGCFVESRVVVNEGDLVKVRLEMPGHGDLTIWGNVVFWVRDTGFGVRFCAFSQGGARDKLAAFLGEEGGRA